MAEPLGRLGDTPNNLPLHLTTFIGRDHELAEVKRLLTTSRLVTLTGAGGCGKSRLAFEIASTVLADYPDGVWLVELASLSDGSLLPQALATVIGLREERDRSLLLTIAEHLGPRRALIILDNCEHLLQSSSSLLSYVLVRCPRLRVITTTREPLGLPGEIICRVGSLRSPDPEQMPNLEGLRACDAARLFVERARLHLPTFTLTAENCGAVAQICHHLDGIPLAIELAAARTRVLTVEEIAARLDRRFQLLTGGSPTLVPRQQTLHATMNWSYQLLSPQEQALWQRLSIFAGGFTLDATELVCDDHLITREDLLDLLTKLIDKSIVIAKEDGSTKRYLLLETIKQFGDERLHESGQREFFRGRHLTWYWARAKEADAMGSTGPQQQIWFERESHNIRAAIRWSKESRSVEAGLGLVCATFDFARRRGYLRELRYHLEELLALWDGPSTEAVLKAMHDLASTIYFQGDHDLAEQQYQGLLLKATQTGTPAMMASALTGIGLLAEKRGEYTHAQLMYEQTLTIYQALADQTLCSAALNNLGRVARFQGDHQRARRLHEEALAIDRRLRYSAGVAAAQGSLGLVAEELGEYEEAGSLHAEALTFWRQQRNHPLIALTLLHLGIVSMATGRLAEARSFIQESLVIYKELENQGGMAESLEGLAAVASAESRNEQAARLLGAATARQQTTRALPAPVRRQRYAQTEGQIRAQMQKAAYDKAWSEGRRWSLEETINAALQEGPSPDRATKAKAEARAYGLTASELKVVRLIAKGLTVKEISERLFLSPRTVGKHEENIRAKLQLPTRIKVASWAIQNGLVEE